MLAMKGSMCSVDYNSWIATMDIWMVKDRSNPVWVKGFSFNISLGPSAEMLGHIHSGDNGEILIMSKEEGLLLYCSDTKSIRKIDLHGNTKPHVYYDGFFSLGS